MNDRKSKRDEDDDAGMDFELQTHRIERRKKIGINSPSLDHSQLSKEGQDREFMLCFCLQKFLPVSFFLTFVTPPTFYYRIF